MIQRSGLPRSIPSLLPVLENRGAAAVFSELVSERDFEQQPLLSMLHHCWLPEKGRMCTLQPQPSRLLQWAQTQTFLPLVLQNTIRCQCKITFSFAYFGKKPSARSVHLILFALSTGRSHYPSYQYSCCKQGQK